MTNNSMKYSMDINLKDINNYNYDYDYNNLKIFEANNILSDISLRKEIVGINPLLFQYNIDYIKRINENNEKDIFLRDKITSLKKMAFQKKDKSDYEIKFEKKFLEMIKHNEEIFIDNEKFKENDIDKIVDKLLKKCNYKPDIHKNQKKFKE